MLLFLLKKIKKEGGSIDIKLTVKQQKFCEYYIASGNATEACVKAGYSKKVAKQQGAENLAKPYIRKYIDKILAEQSSARVADAIEVKEFFTRVMRGELDEEILVVEQDSVTGQSKARKINKPALIKDRLNAAEKLGKIHMMFTDKTQITHEVVMFVDEDLED